MSEQRVTLKQVKDAIIDSQRMGDPHELAYMTSPNGGTLLSDLVLNALESLPAPEETESERHLLSLLAVIHHDGGHYVAEHGLEKAVKDATDMMAPTWSFKREVWSDLEVCSIQAYANAGSSREPVFSKERKAVGKHYPVTLYIHDGHND